MTLEEEMAVAVLKGEKHTALILAQKLMEEHVAGRVEIPPIKTLEIPSGQKKLIVLMDKDFVATANASIWARMSDGIRDWLDGRSSTLGLVGVNTVHLFVEPETPKMIERSLTEETHERILEALRGGPLTPENK